MYSIPSIFFDDSQKSNPLSCFFKPYTNTQKVDKAQILMEINVLSFLLEGEKSIILPDSKASFQKYSFILLKKGKFLMTEKLSGESDVKSLLIFFDNNYLILFFKKYILALSPARTESGFSVLQKDELLNSMAYFLLPYFENKKEPPESISEFKAEKLLLQIVNLHGTESLKTTS